MRRRELRACARFAAIAIGAAVVSTHAADPRHPDWPCRQIKVSSLSVAAMWTGPTLDDVGSDWQHEPQIAELVTTLAARRTPLAAAQKIMAEFLSREGNDRQQRAKLLFAGLFDTLNRERSTVLEGIARFSRKEHGLAEKLRSEAADLRALQSSPNPDQKRIEELLNQVTWDSRIYEDQRQTINYVCEVPQLIEQRLFALSRTIQELLE
jgi:hypothetical protein